VIPRTNPPEYRVAQELARAQESDLSHRALRALAQALRSYGEELAGFLADLPHSDSELVRYRQVRRAQEEINRLATRLQALMFRIVGEHRTASFQEVLEIWRAAGLEAARRVRLPRDLVPGVPRPELTLAGAFEALGAPSRHWRTLLTGYGRSAVAETHVIVREALLRGMRPEELSRRLRPYVQGAEDFHRAFGRTDLVDPILRTPGFEQAAKRLLFQADRIAYSEIHNARHEAERQWYAADPLVAAVGWRTSGSRGSTRIPDVCDYLARGDYYGLGPGVYPIALVPLPPHPHDRCEIVPIVRPAYRAGEAKPEPGLQFTESALVFPENITSARAELIKKQLAQSLRGVAVHPVSARTRDLMK
jgi:hypothetical protein